MNNETKPPRFEINQIVRFNSSDTEWIVKDRKYVDGVKWAYTLDRVDKYLILSSISGEIRTEEELEPVIGYNDLLREIRRELVTLDGSWLGDQIDPLSTQIDLTELIDKIDKRVKP